MKKLSLLISMLVAVSLTACAVVPAGPGYRSNRVAIAPILPSLVVLGIEPYYLYSGYHYHYTNNRWLYSQSRSGPWFDLPRNRYPKEIRFKGRNYDRRYDYRGRDYRRHR